MARPAFRVGVALVCTAALVLLAIDARAEGATIVRIRSDNGALDERLAAELATLGLDVKDIDADPASDLGAIARANGAVAGVRVGAESAIELWVQAREGAPIHEMIAIDPRRGWNVAAVSALEALRAHLIPVRTPPPEPAPPPPAPAPPPPAPEPRAPWLWLHLGAGGDASAGGIGPALDLVAEVRVERAWLGVAAFGALAPTTARVASAEGSASVRRALVGAAVDAQLRAGAVTWSLGCGGAIAILSLHGESAATGYGAADASSVTAGPLARAGAAIAISSALRARAELTSGVTFPRAVVSFAGREIADWGRPFALLTLGVEWGALR